jgi:hypothetical protein
VSRNAVDLENPITSAFTEASSVLSFSFAPWFVVVLDEGSSVQSLGLVRGFGARLGTLLFSEAHRPTSRELAELKGKGYFYSLLFESYRSFDQRLFEDTLTDWGFFGPEDERPVWYTGEPWSCP